MRVGNPTTKFSNPSSPPQTQTRVGKIRLSGLANPNQTYTTQVRHLKLELDLAKSDYEFGFAKIVSEGTPTQTKVLEPK